jgi:hypothetical protein
MAQGASQPVLPLPKFLMVLMTYKGLPLTLPYIRGAYAARMPVITGITPLKTRLAAIAGDQLGAAVSSNNISYITGLK